MKSQNPWTETFVTSAGEVLRPSVPDVIVMLLKDLQDLSQSPRPKPIIDRKLYGRFDPELGLALRMLNMHVSSRFFAREEVEPIAANTENRRTHATRIAQLPFGDGADSWQSWCDEKLDPRGPSAGRLRLDLENRKA
jgi:hypothetical protein